ncbi:MAG: methyltransferase family protein [Alphaproteobacteria bacterium]|jgi:SAM-dependent methyltransferase|nr:methyltransferase family protein [Alphaproteobacteria bacterium]
MTVKKYELKANPHYGFLQIRPTPSLEEINRFYAEEFYSGEYKKFNDSTLEVQLEDQEFYEGTWSDMQLHIIDILGRNPEEIKILDIGCGWAQALLFFKERGFDCYGFDPSPEAIKYGLSKGIKVECAGLENMSVFKDIKFDVVILKNVLEHLPDPEKSLQEIHSFVLNKGGLLVIDVPNEFNIFQIAGKELHNLSDWWIAPPAHLNYFNKDTLTSLLEGVGFEVKLIESSFPLEIFLLFGDCYVGNDLLGKQCHKKRVAFETNLRKLGYSGKLRQLYQALAKLGLGRQITTYAVSK